MKRSATTITEPAAVDPRLVQLSQVITLGEAGKLPTEFCILQAGATRTTKGDILCDRDHAAMCLLELSSAGRDLLPLDYDHDMVSFLGANKKAAGWFKLEDRQGALWATDVQFTPAATKALNDREYRYFSPALYRDEDGYVTRIINVALTCLPATLNQTPLVASESDPHASFGATDAMTLEQLLAAFGAANVSQLAATFNIMQTANGKLTADVADLNTKLSTASAQLTAFAAVAEKAEKNALIATLSGEGKLAPALHGWAASQTLAQLQAYGAVAPVLVQPAVTAPAVVPAASAPAVPTTLSAEELAVCSQMKLSPADFLATKVLQASQANPYVMSVSDLANASKKAAV